MRAARSASNVTIAPSRADDHNKSRCFGPSTRRKMWGTINPTNAMMPVAATALDARRPTIAIVCKRTRSTGTPTCSAERSPSAIKSSVRENFVLSAMPTIASGNTIATARHVARPNEPRLQNVTVRIWSSSAIKTARPINAPERALIAMPVKINVTMSVLPSTRERP